MKAPVDEADGRPDVVHEQNEECQYREDEAYTRTGNPSGIVGVEALSGHGDCSKREYALNDEAHEDPPIVPEAPFGLGRKRLECSSLLHCGHPLMEIVEDESIRGKTDCPECARGPDYYRQDKGIDWAEIAQIVLGAREAGYEDKGKGRLARLRWGTMISNVIRTEVGCPWPRNLHCLG